MVGSAPCSRPLGGKDEDLPVRPVVLLAAPLLAQQAVPGDSVRFGAGLPQAAAGMNFGEVSGVAVNSKGHVFVFTRSNSANGPAYAPAAAQLLEFGAEGRVHPRDRQGSLRLVVRAHRARRQGRQHLGGRQGLRHGHQVQSGRPGHAGLRPPEGIGRRRKPRPWEHVNPPLPHVDGLFRQPTDVAWDSDGQHLHQRRLRQLARRQVRPATATG